MLRHAALLLLIAACTKPPTVASAPDAAVPAPPRCALDGWTPAERCALARAIFHLDGPQGHEAEWFATECGKWPVRVDVGVRCAGHWAAAFGPDADCADQQFIAVNLRAQPNKTRGLLLQLTPADAGFAFRFAPGQLSAVGADGDPKEIESMCGELAGEVGPLDGGWSARTIAP